MSATIPWEIAKKYDVPTPRYTSYPTVPVWSEADAGAVERAMVRAKGGDVPLSVYVHLPFCKRMCSYCGCNVVVSKSYDPVQAYLEALRREINARHALLGSRPLVQFHLGGGTPNFLSPKDLEELAQSVLSCFPPRRDAELAIEVDPATLSLEHLAVLRSVGFNRLSVGVQDFDEEVLAAVGRGGRAQAARRTIDRAHGLGFSSINVDLIYGLPLQTPEHLRKSVEEAAQLGVHRAAVFGYAHVPELRPHQKRLEALGLPSPQARWDMLAAARQAFAAAGYVPIGLDHFALPNDSLSRAAARGELRRNFQGYTVLPEGDVLGFGASAVSDIAGIYIQNQHRVSAYEAAVGGNGGLAERTCELSHDDLLRRRLISELMCNLVIDPKGSGVDFAQYFAPELEELHALAEDGLVSLGEVIAVPEPARPLLRSVANVFDAYRKGRARPMAQAI